jgi:hypothetical protein
MGSVICYHCGKDIPENNLGRQDSCASCGRDTRVCRNCRHWDKNSNNECREEQAMRVVDKEKGNFCEWFQPRQGGTAAAGAPTKDALKSAAEALFKKKS